MDLRGKVVVITGAGSGLGASLAFLAHDRGARVVLAGRRLEKLQETATRCAHGEPALVVPTDVTVHRELRRLVAETLRVFGCIDVLINNAGIGYGGGAGDVRPEEVQHNLMVNTVAPIWLTHLVQPHLEERPEALVVNIISLSGLVAAPSQQVYCASKFGLAGFSQALRRDLANTRVRVLEVYPGAMDTELNTAHLRAIAAKHGTKLVAMPPDSAARGVLRAIERGSRSVLLPAAPSQRLIPLVSRFPRVLDRIFTKMAAAIRAFMLEANKWVRFRNPLEPIE